MLVQPRPFPIANPPPPLPLRSSPHEGGLTLPYSPQCPRRDISNNEATITGEEGALARPAPAGRPGPFPCVKRAAELAVFAMGKGRGLRCRRSPHPIVAPTGAIWPASARPGRIAVPAVGGFPANVSLRSRPGIPRPLVARPLGPPFGAWRSLRPPAPCLGVLRENARGVPVVARYGRAGPRCVMRLSGPSLAPPAQRRAPLGPPLLPHFRSARGVARSLLFRLPAGSPTRAGLAKWLCRLRRGARLLRNWLGSSSEQGAL